MYFDDKAILHYGVKGMHWNVKKAIEEANNEIRTVKDAAKKTLDNVLDTEVYRITSQETIGGGTIRKPNGDIIRIDEKRFKAKVVIGRATIASLLGLNKKVDPAMAKKYAQQEKRQAK